ncbi:uncharacterized protein LOC116121570 [Pistacia vera]|uniref:uncharacterized protein LOC116121570 n=1 Tax=Pistacia vera TaxID=55513 RepID=UPI001262D98A|nr:uncharacterized protein LOC116121570 [Pistacia vera]
MEAASREKIEETVKEILKHGDMEEMTEFKVRMTASERLGVDLSDADNKKFIRGVLESFLLSTIEDTCDAKETDSNVQEETEHQQIKLEKQCNENGDRVMCQLSNKRRVVIQEFRGKALVSIREYYQKDGKQLPSARGISLTSEQWVAFRKSVPAIEEAVMKMQSKLRSESKGEQKEDVPNSVTSPVELSPAEPNRFNGKDYLSWAPRMEFFLKQLQIAYVLTDPCPSVTSNAQANSEEIFKLKTAEQKWLNDDNTCHRHILNSLSDHLYYQYSDKTKSAKELWEELKLVYLFEEIGTKRSKVKKYIEFQMVDEKSILEQVMELNNIADSVVAAGMLIDESFHVNVILSKLPLSWKGLCIKLMHAEHLSFLTLMDHIKAEGETCERNSQGGPSKLLDPLAINFGPRMKEMKRPGMSWKRRESEIDGKTIVCYNCGKKGHMSKHCRNRKFDKEINERQNGDNSTTPAETGG